MSDVALADVEAYLEKLEQQTLLRFIACGSVDDGKSTLIGRVLYESKALYDDQLATLELESRRVGTQGGDLDFALLLDGLTAEREQGITIDVAYRYFSTERRKFIVADTPGHEQYTRNMFTGASTSDCAVILIDARHGVRQQTRRHSFLVSLVGIRHVAVAVNKMDLVEFSRDRFSEIEAEYREFAAKLGIEDICCIPLSALAGDNVVTSSERTEWYEGPTLMAYLEGVEVDADRLQAAPFRFPVQWVNRPNLDFRGYAGTIAGGSVRPGDAVVVLPSGRQSRVASIETYDGQQSVAVAGQSTTITLADEVDVSRGDMLAHPDDPPTVATRLQATVVWMGDDPLLPGRSYLLQVGTKAVAATVAPLKHKIDVNTLEQLPANSLERNEVGVCVLELDEPVAFDPYEVNRDTGGFILVDRITNETVGAGCLRFALRRSDNLRWQEVDVDRDARARAKSQQPAVIWLTGLPGAGKSTIANLVERQLHGRGWHTYLLDGDNIRHGLNRDLGFTDADRVENVRRVAEVASLMVDSGLVVLVSFISPFRAEREMARRSVGADRFLEVFVDAPRALLEERDPKGLYAKARRGELANMSGVNSPYEVPDSPDLRLDTGAAEPTESAAAVVEEVVRRFSSERT
jgi:bifunctional enzyme CysN/CysC